MEEVRSYGQYCPIARASEILGMRWTPIIVRNLLMGCETFSDILEGAPGLSRTTLSDRLRMLERYGIVERDDARYRLTDSGRELDAVLEAMGIWGSRWLEVAPQHLDAHVVLWNLCKLADREEVPCRRLVIRFEIGDSRQHRFWVVVQRPTSEVCVLPPGFDEDLVVTTDSEWLAKWHMGKIPLGRAMHEGLISVQGPTHHVRTLSTLGLSRFAGA